MIAEATFAWRSTQASASWDIVRPASSATGRSRCTASRMSSSSHCLMKRFISLDVARESAGGASPGPVLAGQHALGERRPHDLRDAVALAQRDHLGLGPAPQHRVLRLAGDELRHAGHVERRLDPVRRPLAEADVARLAGLDDLGQRLHRLLERRVVVVAVALVEVDVVGLQPLQRGVDLLVDLLAREAAVAPAHREVDLGRERERVARVAGEDLAPGALGRAAAVHVGGVEERDAGVERRARARLGLLAADAARVGQPRAERDDRDLEFRVAELTMFHAASTLIGLRNPTDRPKRMVMARMLVTIVTIVLTLVAAPAANAARALRDTHRRRHVRELRRGALHARGRRQLAPPTATRSSSRPAPTRSRRS